MEIKSVFEVENVINMIHVLDEEAFDFYALGIEKQTLRYDPEMYEAVFFIEDYSNDKKYFCLVDKTWESLSIEYIDLETQDRSGVSRTDIYNIIVDKITPEGIAYLQNTTKLPKSFYSKVDSLIPAVEELGALSNDYEAFISVLPKNFLDFFSDDEVLASIQASPKNTRLLVKARPEVLWKYYLENKVDDYPELSVVCREIFENETPYKEYKDFETVVNARYADLQEIIPKEFLKA